MTENIVNHINHRYNTIRNYLNKGNFKINTILPLNSNSDIGSEEQKINSIWVKTLNVDNNSIHFNNGVSLHTDDNCNIIASDTNNNQFIIPTLKYIEEMETKNIKNVKSNLETKKNNLLNYFNSLNSTIIELKQEDFLTGTYVIKQPGTYKLTENIEFNPNSNSFLNSEHKDAIALRNANNLSLPLSPYYTSDILPSQFATYNPRAFGLGFFAAIVIQANDVIIDLNGFEIKQSEEHALQQRFFSVFELADQPFIPSQGPHSFGNELIPAKNCYIKNGTIGRSSHHGIHGNNNVNILLQNITFKNYEVAACSLNQVDGLYCCNVTATNRHDIPVLGIWSSARFIRPYINHLLNTNWTGTIAGKNIITIHSELKTAIENTFNQVLSNTWTNSNEYKLFGNSSGFIDGNSYAFLTNTGGVAVLGFPTSRLTASKNIYFNNVSVKNSFASINEIPALRNSEFEHIKDPVGSVFQTHNKDTDGNFLTINSNNTYKGNVVSNAQLAVAKAITENYDFKYLSTTRNSIDTNIIDWADGKSVWNFNFLCNGDSMFHVNKGVVIFKLDASENIYLTNCHCENIKNIGKLGSTLCNDDKDYKNKVGTSHPNATYNGYGGANTRGFSFYTSKNVFVENSSCKNINSSYGLTYGFDIHQFSKDILLSYCEIIGINAGTKADIDDYNDNPTCLPISVGFHVEEHSNSVILQNLSVSEQDSIYKSYKCLKENF